MRSQYISISLAILGAAFTTSSWSQDQFTQDFEPIRKELTAWDPVRGEWLASSMVAISKDEPIPDRYFPEDFTPAEMLKVVPQTTRQRMGTTAQERSRTNDPVAAEQWREINSLLSRTGCSPVMGRSYGDPHLSTFDGVSNSFQTVGEFILVKSASDNMAVHVRQKASTDEVSVSTAIAMNVAGDRVAIYGKDAPDGNTTTPLRINGEAIYLENDTYYLPYGGTVRQDDRVMRDSYLITWPTGETVKVSGTSQMNIAVQVYPCSDRYEGILGNANNDRSDDFNPRGMMGGFGDVASRDFGDVGVSDEMQRQYLAYLSKDFAMSWRITQEESLFEYGFSQSTYTFTDLSYPRVHRTINDLSQQQRDRARRECERAGISGNDLNGCIYDVGFARIPPSPRPVIDDRTTGREIKPVTNRVPNVNPGNPRKPIVVKEGDKQQDQIKPVGNGALPIDQKDPAVSEQSGKEISKPVDSKPVNDKAPQPVKPTPVPVEETKPAPKPYEPPVEEEKPRRVLGGFGKTYENNGSGSGSSGTTTKPVEERKPEPVSRPEPVRPAPTPVSRPEPVRPSPAPVIKSEPTRPAPAPTPAPARTMPSGGKTPIRVG